MSTNLEPVVLSDGFEVNSDAVAHEEKKDEISAPRVSSESARETLTLAEPSNREGLVDGSSGVCSAREDQKESSFDASEAASEEVLNRPNESVNGGDEKRGNEFESVDVENKEIEGLEEVPSAQEEIVGNGDSRDDKNCVEVTEIVEETERMDEDSSCVEKNQETEIDNGVAGDIDSDTTIQDKDQDIKEESVSIAQVTESPSCVVDGDQSTDQNTKIVDENPNTGAFVTIDSNLVDEVTTLKATPPCEEEQSGCVSKLAAKEDNFHVLDGSGNQIDEGGVSIPCRLDEDKKIQVTVVSEVDLSLMSEKQQSIVVDLSVCVSESVASPKEENFSALDGSGDQIDEGGVSIPCQLDEDKKIPVTLVSAVDLSLMSERQQSIVVDLSSSFGRDENRTAFDVTVLGTNEKNQDPDSQAAPDKEEKRTTKRVTLIRNEDSAIYHLPEQDSGFSISDLIWGKVRNHPWWPGQIFDPSDSSEMAAKIQKKNGFLVAYFGDKTFAWCEPSQLRPFRTHFSQLEKQSNSDVFLNAVDSAMDEISRRVELGLACTCIPEEAVADIKCQMIDNAGIREGASNEDGADKRLNATSFKPDKLIEYIKELALFPPGGFDRVEFTIAHSQLIAFYRSKGYLTPPTFYIYRGLSENDADISPLESKPSEGTNGEKMQPSPVSVKAKPKTRSSSSQKEKPVLEEGLDHSRKQRSLAELMAGKKATRPVSVGTDSAEKKFSSKSVSQSSIKKVSTSSSKKRKDTSDSFSEEADRSKKKLVVSSGEVDTESETPKSSFKVGECIRRVASQLTGSPPILKSGHERFQRNVGTAVDRSRDKTFSINDSPRTPKENQRRIEIPKESQDELLSQLCLAARDPMKGYSFLSTIISLFSEFRNLICLDRSGSEKKHKKSLEEKGGKRKSGSRKSAISKTSSPETSPEEKGGQSKIRSKKFSRSKTSSAETFKFDDTRDTYWTDRVVVNGSPDERPSQKTHNKKRKSQRQGRTKRPKPETESEESPQLSPEESSEEKPSQKPPKRKGESQQQGPTKRRKPATKLEESLQWSPKHVSDTSSEEKPLQQIRTRLGKSQQQGLPKSPKPAMESEKSPQLSPKHVSDRSPEEKPSPKSCNQEGETQRQRPKPATEPEDSLQLSPKYVTESSPDANQESMAEEHIGHLEENCAEECLPTALILSFTEADSVPSESKLIEIFSRYGPLKEDETEVLRKTSRARVVFKRKSDAEVAFSSAGKYSIFGPALVSYRLKYLLPAPKASPNATKQSRNDATSLEGNDGV